MPAPVIVMIKELVEARAQLSQRAVLLQEHMLPLHRPPEPLDDFVVERPAPALPCSPECLVLPKASAIPRW